MRKAEKRENNRTFALVGYRVGNTLTDAGSVARGVCVTENGYLRSIVERTKIYKDPAGAHFEDENGETVILPADTPVSMNFWGFTPEIFKDGEQYFERFLKTEHPDPLKSECYLPNVVGEMIENGCCEVEVLETSSQWYGVTYQEDKANVTAKIRMMIEQGEYPDGLWK